MRQEFWCRDPECENSQDNLKKVRESLLLTTPISAVFGKEDENYAEKAMQKKLNKMWEEHEFRRQKLENIIKKYEAEDIAEYSFRVVARSVFRTWVKVCTD